jgi:hypothetical protein
LKDSYDSSKLFKNITILKELKICNHQYEIQNSKHLFQKNLEILEIEDDYPNFNTIVKVIKPLMKLKKFIL